MRLRLIAASTVVTLMTMTAGSQAPSSLPQVKIAIDPRSDGEAQSVLIVKGFGNSCPNVSIIRDESEAEYLVFATEGDVRHELLLHYFITVYDKQGKMVFATDKHTAKNASEAACRFINGQK